MNSKHTILGGILLVAGTTVGAGMLGLPVITGLSGFFPSVLLFIAYWIFMTYTAFLMLEVNLWMDKKHSNLISMAKATLGKWGELVSWLVYLFLLYALMTAYIAGSTMIVQDFIEASTGYKVNQLAAALPLLLFFGIFVTLGTKSVDYFNRLLMFGLVAAYILMIAFTLPKVQLELLAYRDWDYLPMAVSIVATSFGFHIIIPSLKTYLHGNINHLKLVIWVGSAIPLLVYILWEMVTLGIIHLDGPYSIWEGYRQGANGAHLLAGYLENPMIAMLARFFSFFAIITSFLGVSLSLTHFLADGLKIKHTFWGNIYLYCLTFFPPTAITLIDPRAFLSALEYAGAFGVAILLGLIPALMAWRGRYHKNYNGHYRTPGGKPALIAVIIASTLVVGLEIASKLNLIPD